MTENLTSHSNMDILYEWDCFPHIFSFEIENKLYLAYHCKCSNENEDAPFTYLLTNINKENLKKLKENQLFVRDAIFSGDITVVVTDQKFDVIKRIPLDKYVSELIGDKFLPEEHIMLYSKTIE